MRRIQNREANERDAGQLKTPALIFARLGDGGVERVQQELGAFSGHRGDQRVLVREMVVGGGRGDAGATRDVPQRQAGGTDVWKHVQGRRDQRLSQVPVMVGALARGRGREARRARGIGADPVGIPGNVKGLASAILTVLRFGPQTEGDEMPQARIGGHTIEYATTGDERAPALVLIMGTAAPLTMWDDDSARRWRHAAFASCVSTTATPDDRARRPVRCRRRSAR